MKTSFLSTLLCLGCWFSASAQDHKVHFGLGVRAGNYLPGKQYAKTAEQYSIKHTLSSGLLTGLDAYLETMLGRHLALFSGLQLARSAFTDQWNGVYLDTGKIVVKEAVYSNKHHFSVVQLSLPVQFELRIGQRRQVDVAFGVAPTFTAVKSRFEPIDQPYNPYYYSIEYFCQCDIYSSPPSIPPPTDFQILYTAGVHYRPDPRNAVGFEFWVAPKPRESGNYDPWNAFSDPPYRMRSVQFSIRHNW